MAKISIIVPVYNVEKYLDECVKSLLVQTHTDLEILLIDDGSKDNSGKICDEWAKRDSRIFVFHKENGGASDARNYGLCHATGDYVGFVDSDDYIMPQMYERLLELSKQCDADISVINVAKLYCDGSLVKGNQNKGIIIWNTVDCVRDYFSDNHKYPHSVCCKLCKKHLFDDIAFPKGLNIEDTNMSLLVMQKSERIIQDFDSYMYIYRMRPNSTTKSFNLHVFDQFNILCKCYHTLVDGVAKQLCLKRIVRSYISTLALVYAEKRYYNDSNFAAKINEIKNVVKPFLAKYKPGKVEMASLIFLRYFPTAFAKLYSLKPLNKGRVDTPVKGEEALHL